MKIISVYLKNNSSYDHQPCCENSPTKGRYDHFQSGDLDLHSRSQVRLRLDYFLTWNISDNIDAITFIHDVRQTYGCLIIMLILMSMTLPLMQGHSGSAKAKNHRCMLSAWRDLDTDFANVNMTCPTCLSSAPRFPPAAQLTVGYWVCSLCSGCGAFFHLHSYTCS